MNDRYPAIEGSDRRVDINDEFRLMYARYAAKEWTHDQFYLWLSDRIGLTESVIPFSEDAVHKSTDEHLNDLPLHTWDARNGLCTVIGHGAGLKGWAPSYTVSCLKAMARRRGARTRFFRDLAALGAAL